MTDTVTPIAITANRVEILTVLDRAGALRIQDIIDLVDIGTREAVRNRLNALDGAGLVSSALRDETCGGCQRRSVWTEWAITDLGHVSLAHHTNRGAVAC